MKVAGRGSTSPFVIEKRRPSIALLLSGVEELLTDDAIKAAVFHVSFCYGTSYLYLAALNCQLT